MSTRAEADLRFLERFESCKISADEFGHREHVRLAYIYLSREPFDLALQRMQLGLRRLLTHLGAPPSKYHETMTQAWLLAVFHFMQSTGPADDFEGFLNHGGGRLLDKDIMGTHYSRDLLMSEHARHEFVAADLAPIPRHQGETAASYLSAKTKVQESSIHGRGLFAVAAIAQNEIVAVKGGHIISRETLAQLTPRLGSAEIQIAEDLFICPVTDEEREGSMIFSNHSCAPNLGLRGQIVFVAMRDIAAGEELTHDWAMTDDDDSASECNCGAANCRGTVTGKDWQRPELQERYGAYFSSYLLEKMRRLQEA